jgi:hypothetical protein
MGASEWIGGSGQNATVWTTIPQADGTDQKDMASYGRVIVTLLVTTVPISGNLAVKIQHSSDYGIRTTPHWQDLLLFEAVDAGTPAEDLTQLLSTDVFHGWLRVQSKCSEADQTVYFDVDIEGKP